MDPDFAPVSEQGVPLHRRRPRYAGKNPRQFHQKYKELGPAQNPETIRKVLASGKTPAGMHRPILLAEILRILDPKPGELAVDCTLGFGGHAEALLHELTPGGHLIGLDVDPIEQTRTGARLRALGFGEDTFTWLRSNFAGLAAIVAARSPVGANVVLADLGVSSMQIDNPARGFSVKQDGPLDMRMNPERGLTASTWLERTTVEKLARCLAEFADEPRAMILAPLLAGKHFTTTQALAEKVASATPRVTERPDTIRRVFQALRIAVNDEFGALDALLRCLPASLCSGGRVAILSFHSGEDRRVKHAFREGLRTGIYSSIAEEVIRAGSEERRANPRSTSAKLRWAQKEEKQADKASADEPLVAPVDEEKARDFWGSVSAQTT